MKVLSQEFILPAYLPSGFAEADRSEYQKKGYSVTELVYRDDNTGYLIWIKESKGPIPSYEPSKNMQTTDKVIGDVSVHMEREILKPSSKRTQKDELPFIEANWSHKGINFNLRSDGLSLDDTEKVVTSMISKGAV